MNKRLPLAIVIFGLLVLPASARAFNDPGDLANVDFVFVTVRIPDSDTKFIGVDMEDLRSRFETRLQSFSVPVSQNSGDLQADIQVITIKTSANMCSVYVNINAIESVINPWNHRLLHLSAWEKGTLLTGPQSSMPDRIKDRIDDFATDLATDWLRDNRRRLQIK
jgi:hypothetical protein